MRGWALAAGALLLSGCDRGTEPQPVPTPPTPTPVIERGPAPVAEPAVPTSPAVPLTLSPAGVGPLRVGMTPEEAARALGAPLDFDGGYGVQPEQCRYGRSSRLPGVLVMFEGGRLARVDLARGSVVKTDKGLGLGDTAEAVRTAYGAVLHQGGHKYLAAPAAYLEAWNPDRSRGVRYEIDEQGKVSDIYAGGPAVNYVEGCS